MLFNAVGIKEIAGDINYRLAAVIHFHSSVARNGCNGRCRKVLLLGKRNKLIHVVRGYDNRHSLLTFGNGKLGTRKSLVLFGHFVKLNYKSVGKFAYGYGNTARAEVVALFNRIGVQKQPLQLSFRQRVALLHFRAAGLHRLFIVRLGRARCAAATVAPRFPAEKHDYVALRGFFAVNHIRFSSADYKARFQSLSLETGVINFFYLTGGKPYLVAVGREARRRRLGYYALGQFARDCILNRFGRVRAACYAHRLQNVSPARKRVAYSAAQARCRPAERFYFRGMVVRFVFKHYGILLFFTVDYRVNLNRAGVNFVAFVKIVEQPLFL